MRLDGGTGSGAISSRIASNTTRNCSSYFCSNSFRRRARSACVASIARRRTKALIVAMFTSIARSLFSTLDALRRLAP